MDIVVTEDAEVPGWKEGITTGEGITEDNRVVVMVYLGGQSKSEMGKE